MVANSQQTAASVTPALHRYEDLVRQAYRTDTAVQEGTQSLRSLIRAMAEALEEHFLAYGQAEQVIEISNTIARRFKDDHRKHLQSYIVDALPEKYIRKLDKSSITSLAHAKDLPVHCTVRSERYTGVLKEMVEVDFDELDKGTIIDMADMASKIVNAAKAHAKANNYEVITHDNNKNQVDKTNDDSDQQYEDKISQPNALIPTDDAILLLDEEAHEYGMQYIAAQKQWFDEQNTNNHSQTLEQAARFRDATLAALRMIKQINDRKSRRTMKDWADILQAQSERGGTGASSFSKRIVTDPQTMKPMIDKRTLQPVYREITKEQIDARGPKYASELEQIIACQPLPMVQQERYVEITCGLRDWRAHEAEEKLSRQA